MKKFAALGAAMRLLANGEESLPQKRKSEAKTESHCVSQS